MPIPVVLAAAAAAWVGAGLGLGVLLGRAMVRADQQQACTCGACYCLGEAELTALVQPESWAPLPVDYWTQPEVDAEAWRIERAEGLA